MSGSMSSVSNSISVVTEYYKVCRNDITMISKREQSHVSYDNDDAVMSSVARDLLKMRQDCRYGYQTPLGLSEIECMLEFVCTI